jgi:hypothetical protein
MIRHDLFMNPFALSLSKSRASTGSARTVLMSYSGLNRAGAILIQHNTLRQAVRPELV